MHVLRHEYETCAAAQCAARAHGFEAEASVLGQVVEAYEARTASVTGDDLRRAYVLAARLLGGGR